MSATDLTTRTETAAADGTTRRVLQRQILPVDRDTDVLKLYVDPDPAVLDADKYEVGHNKQARELNAAAMRQAVGSGSYLHPDQIESRTAYRVPMGEKVSFGTYFNAFAASYWRKWTVVTEVDLTVSVRGRGAQVIVYKSMANGRSQRVDSAMNETDEGVHAFSLTLKPFVDGGWYWYDVVAADEDAIVDSAEWSALVPAQRAQHGTVTIGITTMNRQDFCAKLLGQLGADDVLRDYLDEVVVMEQGSQPVTESEHFPAAQEALGETLRVIVQGNIGGSGGFARAQYETLRAGRSTYSMMLDDDVEVETEGIIRAITFGDLCRRPTIVGGHMFSIYSKTRMHSFGEKVNPYSFWWGSAPGVTPDWDLGARNLRSTRWLHARVDVDYNGWFMCLIPTRVLEEIGLGLPLFIKWDDSEYGLRAKEAGFPTVTFPGAAVWHVPWTDKNDALDWQAYFHVRNRFVAALLHSKYPHGGRMIQESLNHQIKHLVSMQYSTVALRHQALEDVLAGPQELHPTLGTKLPEIRAAAKEFTDARLESDPDAFPDVRRLKPPRKGREGDVVISGRQASVQALLQPLRQLRRPRDLAQEHPEVEIPAQDAKWHRIARYDSAIVSMPDGTAAAFYKRDRATFFEMLRKTIEIHRRLRAEWEVLAATYQASLEEVTAPETWERTFAASTENDR